MTPSQPFPDRTRVDPDSSPPTEPLTADDAGGPTLTSPSPGSIPPEAFGSVPPTLDDIPNPAGGTPVTFGRYELLGEIARGGMGIVYRARQHGLDRVVALKMVVSGAGESALRQRLLQEARAAASLDHPNVVPIYDSGDIDGRLFFTMAFVDGPDLKKYTDGRGRLSLAEAVRLFVQVVAGVAHAHAKGIIHRDLKPANVLIDQDGRPRVTDFGLAKRTHGDTDITKTGQVMGTPAYMPPEQARGEKNIGPPADVYSLGGILYYLLTGRPPFTGETVTEILLKLATENPAPPREVAPDVPPELEAICLACLAKSPADRYPDAVALFDALAPIAEKYMPLSAHKLPSLPSVAERTPRPGLESTTISSAAQNRVAAAAPPAIPQSRRVWYAVGAVATAAAVVVIGLLAFRGGGSSGGGPGLGQTSVGGEVAGNGNTSVGPGKGQPPAGSAWNAVNGGPKAQFVSAAPWPAMRAKNDFDLTFKLIAPGRSDENGVIQIPKGTKLAFQVTAEVDCYLGVWSVDPDGQVVQLFPNNYDQNSELRAGQTREMPGEKAYNMTASLTRGAGAETLRVLASTVPIPVLTSDEIVEGFPVFKKETARGQFSGLYRGIDITAKKTDLKLAEAELRYRVTDK